MLTIKCAKCKSKLFKYIKKGKGKLWHCWKERIVEDFTVKDGDEVRCTCGQLIGIDQKKWIKLKPHNIIYKGSRER
ncbi:hypothetical protein J7M23_12915 [Candidatus Sumerlaeota bacterium]|nr:hypothetical protein [Candidatus Sumerlaeota bacterium]